LVGDRLFVMAEPDELLCIDRKTGRIRWTASHSYYDALPESDRKAKTAFKEKIDPLVASLKKETDRGKRVALRGQIRKELLAIDAEKLAIRANDHFASHFGIVGFTSPSAVSDGKHVWVWCGNGVAACHDLAGKRKWITRIETRELAYASTPTLVDDVLVVFL